MLVRTSEGLVLGRRFADHVTFLGIPYATAPHGADRFRAPRAHDPWEDIWDATRNGPTAPQGVRALGTLDMEAYFGPGWRRGSEYLNVNVWAPPIADVAHPVMVFVHGGGFIAGSNQASLYNGSGFARSGVVLVTLNYRLGIAGFLDIPDAPRNRGLLDVVEALRWVQRNIGAFGGDPDNVTVFGQSAGATLVSALLASSEIEGLARRAITQSGSGSGAFTTEQASRVTSAAAERLGIESHVQAYGQVSDEALVGAAGRLTGLDLRTATAFDPLIGLSPFSVVLDQQPAESVARGRGAAIDLMIGTNTEEGNLYLAPFGKLVTSTKADVGAVAALMDPDPDTRVAALLRDQPGLSDGELRSALMSEALFVGGSRALADAHAPHRESRTYRYEFGWRSTAFGGQLGAAHAVELPFVFDATLNDNLRGENRLLGSHKPPSGLAETMHRAWVSFASFGDPGWPTYGPCVGATMRIGENGDLSVVSGPP